MKSKKTPVQPRKRPLQARSRVTVAAILEAAAQLLDESGYAKLNTNAIAERAGMSVGSLYQYFPNKEAICAELVRQYLERQAEAFARNLEDTWISDPAQQIRRTVRTTIEIARADRRAASVLYNHLRFVPGDDSFLKARKEMERNLRRRYEQPVGAGGFPNPDITAFFVVNVMGSLLGETLQQHPEWLNQERYVEEMSRLFISYLTADRRAAGPVL